MREPPHPHAQRQLLFANPVVTLAVVVGFFAVLVAAAHPLAVGLFLAGALTAVVTTALYIGLSRRRAVCIPKTGVCLRLSAE